MKTESNKPMYVGIQKRRGSIGIYREIMTEPGTFEDIDDELDGIACWATDDLTVSFSIEPYNGKVVGEHY